MCSQPTTHRFLALVVILISGVSATLAGPELVENFESAPLGATASEAGWVSLNPAAPITSWIVRDSKKSPPPPGLPYSPAGNGTRTLTQQPDGGRTTLAKPFPGAARLPADGILYYSVRLVPHMSGTSVQQLRIGAVYGKASFMAPVFGVDGETAKEVYFTIWTRGKPYVQTRSAQSYAPDQWYELVCVLDLRTPTSAKASLYVRNLTLGETTLQPVKGLQRISLDFGPDTGPASWTAWAILGGFRQEIDDLRLATAWTSPVLPAISPNPGPNDPIPTATAH
jgi:hypothetical protein